MAFLNPDHRSYKELSECMSKVSSSSNLHVTLLEIHLNRLKVRPDFFDDINLFESSQDEHPLQTAMFGLLGNIKFVPHKKPTGFKILGEKRNFISQTYVAEPIIRTRQPMYQDQAIVAAYYNDFVESVISYIAGFLDITPDEMNTQYTYIADDNSRHYAYMKHLRGREPFPEDVMVIPDYYTDAYSWEPHISIMKSNQALDFEHLTRLNRECNIQNEISFNPWEVDGTKIPFSHFEINMLQPKGFGRLNPVILNL